MIVLGIGELVQPGPDLVERFRSRLIGHAPEGVGGGPTPVLHVGETGCCVNQAVGGFDEEVDQPGGETGLSVRQRAQHNCRFGLPFDVGMLGQLAGEHRRGGGRREALPQIRHRLGADQLMHRRYSRRPVISALDSSAILRGVTRSLIGIVPAIVMLLVLGDEDNSGTDQSNWVYLALVLIVVGFLIGGAVAGHSAPQSPFTHGAVAAFIAWGVPQVISIIVNIAQDDGVNVVGLFFNGLLAASIGVVGAGIGIRRGTLDDGGGEPAG